MRRGWRFNVIILNMYCSGLRTDARTLCPSPRRNSSLYDLQLVCATAARLVYTGGAGRMGQGRRCRTPFCSPEVLPKDGACRRHARAGRNKRVAQECARTCVYMHAGSHVYWRAHAHSYIAPLPRITSVPVSAATNLVGRYLPSAIVFHPAPCSPPRTRLD